jgi:hypothetical protein
VSLQFDEIVSGHKQMFCEDLDELLVFNFSRKHFQTLYYCLTVV